MGAVPAADSDREDDAGDGDERAPPHARLPVRRDQKRREHRTQRRAGVAADLEDRLRQPVPSARGHPRDARRFRVEDRRTDADQRRRREQQRIRPRDRQQQQADQREAHADDQRVRRRPSIGQISRRPAAAAMRVSISASVIRPICEKLSANAALSSG